jgi:hypothetical protein
MNKKSSATFINIEIDKPIKWEFLIKHILFSLIWIVGLAIIIFRMDLNLTQFLPNNSKWITRIIPFIYFVIVLIIMFMSKWYYNLVLVFYPFLAIVWFLPKLVLTQGKIFLLSNYLSSIVSTIKRFKIRIFYFGLFLFALFLLLITNSNIGRIFSILVFTFFYYRYLFSYVRKSLNPPALFGFNIEKSIDEIIESSEKGMFLVNIIQDQKEDEKLSEDEKQNAKLNKLILVDFFISFFKDQLSGFNLKKSFVIAWIYQLFIFFLITLLFYSFVNFELFLIDNHNFKFSGNPSLFDFFYYTIKTIVFGNINDAIPSSVFAKISEILSFLTLGVFVLTGVTSVIFSLRADRYSDNMKKVTELCIQQNQIINQYIKDKYNADIQTIIKESDNMRTSLANIKNVVERLF